MKPLFPIWMRYVMHHAGAFWFVTAVLGTLVLAAFSQLVSE